MFWAILAAIAAIIAGAYAVVTGTRHAETIGIIVCLAAAVVVYIKLFHGVGLVVW